MTKFNKYYITDNGEICPRPPKRYSEKSIVAVITFAEKDSDGWVRGTENAIDSHQDILSVATKKEMVLTALHNSKFVPDPVLAEYAKSFAT